MAVTWTFFTTFVDALGKELHNFSTDTFKLALSNTLPTAATDDQLADIAQITAANGYSAGGYTLANVTWSAGAGSKKIFDADDVTVTATGGSIGPFQYCVIYNDTAPGDELIGFFTLDAAETVLDGEAPILKFNASGIFDIDVV